MKPVLSLIEYGGMRAIENLACDFMVPIDRQAMHDYAFSIREIDQPLIQSPVLVFVDDRLLVLGSYLAVV
jgi:hypothetical protein